MNYILWHAPLKWEDSHGLDGFPPPLSCKAGVYTDFHGPRCICTSVSEKSVFLILTQVLWDLTLKQFRASIWHRRQSTNTKLVLLSLGRSLLREEALKVSFSRFKAGLFLLPGLKTAVGIRAPIWQWRPHYQTAVKFHSTQQLIQQIPTWHHLVIAEQTEEL